MRCAVSDFFEKATKGLVQVQAQVEALGREPDLVTIFNGHGEGNVVIRYSFDLVVNSEATDPTPEATDPTPP